MSRLVPRGTLRTSGAGDPAPAGAGGAVPAAASCLTAASTPGPAVLPGLEGGARCTVPLPGVLPLGATGSEGEGVTLLPPPLASSGRALCSTPGGRGSTAPAAVEGCAGCPPCSSSTAASVETVVHSEASTDRAQSCWLGGCGCRAGGAAAAARAGPVGSPAGPAVPPRPLVSSAGLASCALALLCARPRAGWGRRQAMASGVGVAVGPMAGMAKGRRQAMPAAWGWTRSPTLNSPAAGSTSRPRGSCAGWVVVVAAGAALLAGAAGATALTARTRARARQPPSTLRSSTCHGSKNWQMEQDSASSQVARKNDAGSTANMSKRQQSSLAGSD